MPAPSSPTSAAAGVADPATAAELALVEAQVALGDGRAGSRAEAEHLAAAAVGLATEAGRPELACEALETLGSCARLRDLDAAAAAFRRALDSAGSLPVHRLRILNELGTVEMLRDARSDRLEQARPRRSGPAPWAWPPVSVPTWPHCWR